MTNEVIDATPARRDQIRVRLAQIKESRQRKVLGVAEIAGLAGATLMLVLALVSYFYFLAPARVRLDALQQERAGLQKQLRTAQEGYQHSTDTKTTVDTINTSLEDFERAHLVARGTGRMALYAELNQLIRNNGLRNTAGPTYSMLAPVGTKQAGTSSTKQGNARWQSVFPGIGVSVTVEGSYQNLRHFLRDIETSRQFLIVNAVELESTTESNAAPPSEGEPRAGARKGIVSLRLDMATYFQRGATESSGTPDSAVH
ncbi:MAG: Type secretion system protein subtype b [Blastocatellia bacterium]|jgi:Tfp pilus assembly protein PilO|nr:Type secretion system protein subtype b [Blastocatellia bacterium]